MPGLLVRARSLGVLSLAWGAYLVTLVQVQDVTFGTASSGAALLVLSWHNQVTGTEMVTYQECRV